MRLIRIVIGAALIAAAAVFGFDSTSALLSAAPENTAPRAGGGQAALAVQTVPASMMTFADTVEAVGTTRAVRAVELHPATTGRVSALHIIPGAEVRAGAVLLRLEDAAERAALKSAEATLAEARAAYDRQARLDSSGSTTGAAIEAAQATLLRAEAERDMAQAALDDLELRAPFAGVVGFTDLAPGQLVTPADIVTSLDDLSRIEVGFRVPERVMARIAPGLGVTLVSSAWPGRVFDGTINAVDTRVDQATRSIALRAVVDNGDGAMVPGMFMEVSLVLDRRQALAVPERALIISGTQAHVFAVQDGRARRVEVVTGQSRDGLIEVSGALEEGTAVIVSNLHRVTEGADLRPAEEVAQ